MDTFKVCNAMWQRAFGPEFGKAIREDYQTEDFDDIEGDLRTGKEKLLAVCSKGQMVEIQKAEQLYNRAGQVAAEDSFYAGMFAGFRHYFTSGKYDELSFYELVSRGQVDGVATPSAARRRTLENEANRIIDALSVPGNHELEEHILSVSCGWGQRVYYSGYMAFRLGYAAAWNILEGIDPAVTGEVVMTELLKFEKEGGVSAPIDNAEPSEDAKTAAAGELDTKGAAQ